MTIPPPDHAVAQAGHLRALGTVNARRRDLASAEEALALAEAELKRVGAKAVTPQGTTYAELAGQAHALTSDAQHAETERQAAARGAELRAGRG